ncbi:SDR family oxidoreductase [Crocinitomix algicola]|uniref:SDR family oxidoreductase n=1 Tax=Crocinitomix algicola TaxID=1740263 RepID=UPI0008336B9B|nr:SDR family oxidoreductase [Crocinitomix algicola]
MTAKTILLIGSSGGLGSELVKYYKDKNYNLALHYHQHPNMEPSDRIKTYQADITIESEVSRMITQVKTDFGRIDVVIHNAGVSKNSISWKLNVNDWNETIAVNLTGPFLVTKFVTPIMRSQNFGRIIFMSSVVAQTGFVGTAAYAASKAGLLGLTKTLAKELANKNITVNAIALGYFNVGMIHDVPAEMQEELKKKIPMATLGSPQQLAALIEYISSEQANYLTGQTLNLNGGLHS